MYLYLKLHIALIIFLYSDVTVDAIEIDFFFVFS